jgi:peptidoglycan/LPS O-acetylase OafA/YrhL
MKRATLGDCLSGPGVRDNAFDTIRLLAAAFVIFSHAFVLVDGRESAEPLYNLSDGQITIGRGAVAAFFVVSGLLISMSFERSKSWIKFTINRALRLLPGLWVCVFVLVLFFGPVMTRLPLPDYFQSPETLGFLGNLALIPRNHSIGGVFDGLPGSDAVNGSLWTLKYEVACYVFGALLLCAGRFKIGVTAALWIGAMIAAPIIGDPLEQRGAAYHGAWMVWLFRFYGAGMLLYLLRDHIPLSKPAALACLAVILGATFTPAYTEALAIFGSYALIASAFLAADWFKKMTHRGDISYGVYIYAFPVQQALVPFSNETAVPWLTNAALSLPITLLLAALSWTFVEKPALALKNRFGARKTAAPTT